MSETVVYKGKIKLVASGEEEIASFASKYVKDNKIEVDLDDDHDPNLDYILNELYPVKFVKWNDELFEVLTKIEQDQDIFYLTKTAEGEYEYLVQYYNGGCGFSEAIECALEKKHH